MAGSTKGLPLGVAALASYDVNDPFPFIIPQIGSAGQTETSPEKICCDGTPLSPAI